MLDFLRTYKWFFTIFFLFIAFALFVLMLLPTKESVLALNGINNAVLDQFFYYMTMMGEVLGGVVVALILIFRRSVKHVLFFLIAISISTSLSSSLKNFVFENSFRPSHHYEEVREVNGDRLHTLNSFPSGHTTAAFCMFGFLAFVMKKNNWQLWCVLTACLVGISRVYLGQHFPADVLAGSCLGTAVASLAFILIPDLPPDHWLNKRVSGNEQA